MSIVVESLKKTDINRGIEFAELQFHLDIAQR